MFLKAWHEPHLPVVRTVLQYDKTKSKKVSKSDESLATVRAYVPIVIIVDAGGLHDVYVRLVSDM
jgi:hypothetical protein